MTPESGPYINAAYFCQPTSLPDGTYAIPPDNCFSVAEQRGDRPEMPVFSFRATLFLLFRGGAARGRVDCAIVCERPNGLRMAPVSLALDFTDEDSAQVRFLDLDCELDLAGVYWFSVLVGDRLLTRVPLRVRYLPAWVG